MKNLNSAYGMMQKLCCLCDNLVTILRKLMYISHEIREIMQNDSNQHKVFKKKIKENDLIDNPINSENVKKISYIYES